MSAPKHSPGPWKQTEHSGVRDAEGDRVLFSGLSLAVAGGHDLERLRANDALAIAAPALAGALQAAVLVLEGDTSGDALTNAIRKGHAALRAAGWLP